MQSLITSFILVVSCVLVAKGHFTCYHGDYVNMLINSVHLCSNVTACRLMNTNVNSDDVVTLGCCRTVTDNVSDTLQVGMLFSSVTGDDVLVSDVNWRCRHDTRLWSDTQLAAAAAAAGNDDSIDVAKWTQALVISSNSPTVSTDKLHSSQFPVDSLFQPSAKWIWAQQQQQQQQQQHHQVEQFNCAYCTSSSSTTTTTNDSINNLSLLTGDMTSNNMCSVYEHEIPLIRACGYISDQDQCLKCQCCYVSSLMANVLPTCYRPIISTNQVSTYNQQFCNQSFSDMIGPAVLTLLNPPITAGDDVNKLVLFVGDELTVALTLQQTVAGLLTIVDFGDNDSTESVIYEQQMQLNGTVLHTATIKHTYRCPGVVCITARIIGPLNIDDVIVVEPRHKLTVVGQQFTTLWCHRKVWNSLKIDLWDFEESSLTVEFLVATNATYINSHDEVMLTYGDGSDDKLNGSHLDSLQVNFDFDNWTSLCHLSRDFHTFIFTHTYSMIGSYRPVLNVTLCSTSVIYNSASDVVVGNFEDYRQLIGDIVIMSSNNEQTILLNTEVMFIVCLKHKPPSNVDMSFNYSDGSPVVNNLLPVIDTHLPLWAANKLTTADLLLYTVSLPHNYTTIGVYSATVTISHHDVSDWLITANITVTVKSLSQLVGSNVLALNSPSADVKPYHTVMFQLQTKYFIGEVQVSVDFVDGSDMSVYRLPAEPIVTDTNDTSDIANTTDTIDSSDTSVSDSSDITRCRQLMFSHQFVRWGRFRVLVELTDTTQQQHIMTSLTVNVVNLTQAVGRVSLSAVTSQLGVYLINSLISFKLSVQHLLPNTTLTIDYGNRQELLIVTSPLVRMVTTQCLTATETCFVVHFHHIFDQSGRHNVTVQLTNSVAPNEIVTESISLCIMTFEQAIGAILLMSNTTETIVTNTTPTAVIPCNEPIALLVAVEHLLPGTIVTVQLNDSSYLSDDLLLEEISVGDISREWLSVAELFNSTTTLSVTSVSHQFMFDGLYTVELLIQNTFLPEELILRQLIVVVATVKQTSVSGIHIEQVAKYQQVVVGESVEMVVMVETDGTTGLPVDGQLVVTFQEELTLSFDSGSLGVSRCPAFNLHSALDSSDSFNLSQHTSHSAASDSSGSSSHLTDSWNAESINSSEMSELIFSSFQYDSVQQQCYSIHVFHTFSDTGHQTVTATYNSTSQTVMTSFSVDVISFVDAVGHVMLTYNDTENGSIAVCYGVEHLVQNTTCHLDFGDGRTVDNLKLVQRSLINNMPYCDIALEHVTWVGFMEHSYNCCADEFNVTLTVNNNDIAGPTVSRSMSGQLHQQHYVQQFIANIADCRLATLLFVGEDNMLSHHYKQHENITLTVECIPATCCGVNLSCHMCLSVSFTQCYVVTCYFNVTNTQLYIVSHQLPTAVYSLSVLADYSFEDNLLHQMKSKSIDIVIETAYKQTVHITTYKHRYTISDMLMLNASLSTDSNSVDVNYYWTCAHQPSVNITHFQHSNALSTCLADYTLSHDYKSPILHVPACKLEFSTLPQTYYFTVHARHDDVLVEGSVSEIAVSLVRGVEPFIVIYCLQNCQQFINTNDRLILAYHCTNCHPAERLKQQWTLRPVKRLQPTDIVQQDHQHNFIVNTWILKDTSNYTLYTVQVTVTRQDKTQSTTFYDFRHQPVIERSPGSTDRDIKDEEPVSGRPTTMSTAIVPVIMLLLLVVPATVFIAYLFNVILRHKKWHHTTMSRGAVVSLQQPRIRFVNRQ